MKSGIDEKEVGAKGGVAILDNVGGGLGGAS
jgi:hypothetical protein